MFPLKIDDFEEAKAKLKKYETLHDTTSPEHTMIDLDNVKNASYCGGNKRRRSKKKNNDFLYRLKYIKCTLINLVDDVFYTKKN